MQECINSTMTAMVILGLFGTFICTALLGEPKNMASVTSEVGIRRLKLILLLCLLTAATSWLVGPWIGYAIYAGYHSNLATVYRLHGDPVPPAERPTK